MVWADELVDLRCAAETYADQLCFEERVVDIARCEESNGKRDEDVLISIIQSVRVMTIPVSTRAHAFPRSNSPGKEVVVLDNVVEQELWKHPELLGCLCGKRKGDRNLWVLVLGVDEAQQPVHEETNERHSQPRKLGVKELSVKGVEQAMAPGNIVLGNQRKCVAR